MAQDPRIDNVGIAEIIDTLARPMAEANESELVDVIVKGDGTARRKISVILDRKGGVTIDACRTVAKGLSRALDEMAREDRDPIPGRYTLEVTSPGTDRPLETQHDFDRIEGRLVKAIVSTAEGTTREVIGTVTSAGADAVVLTPKKGEPEALAYGDIVKATQELPW